MNQDDIIRMAREAGIPIEINWAGRPSTLVLKDGGTYFRGVDDLERFAKLIEAAVEERLKWDGLHSCHPECDRPACVHTRRAVEAEREACAKLCEEIDAEYEGEDVLATWCAAAIRARGQ